ncbi:MAG TPA: hypothetical protein VN442_20195 [Bryobacteraceae bacterium]|nr:hypothetical protein [Bryobacteraceae bacterium]
MLPLRLALAIIDEELRRDAEAAIAESPARVVADCRRFSSWRAFLDQLVQAQPHLVLLDISSLPTSLDDAVGSLRLAASANVAAVNTTADSESILRAVRAGANDYLYPPMRFTLRRLLERKSQELQHSGGTGECGRVLAFLSAKGGCGATTIACRIAGELAERGAPRGRNVLLADLDLNAGVAGFLLQAGGPWNVKDAIDALPVMDAGRWRALVSPVPGGFDVLPAPRAAATTLEPFTPDQVRDFVTFIRGHYDFSVLDVGRGWNPAAFDVLRSTDVAFLVFTADLPALNHTRRLLDQLQRDGVPPEKMRLVLNQAPREMCFTVGEIESLMSLPIFAVVPQTHLATRDDLLIPAGALGRQLYELALKTGAGC